jgi:hypothetical protein
LARTGITRLFNQHAVFGIQQNLRGKLQALLRPSGHQNLREVASDRAKGAQVLRDRLAERLVSHGVAIGYDASCRTPAMARHQL